MVKGSWSRGTLHGLDEWVLDECWLLRRFQPPWGGSIEYWYKVETANPDGHRGQAHFVNKGEGQGRPSG